MQVASCPQVQFVSIEVNCDTDFFGRNEKLKKLVDEKSSGVLAEYFLRWNHLSTDGTEESNRVPSLESPVTEEVQEEHTPVAAHVRPN